MELKKYWRNNQGQGPTPCPRGWGGGAYPPAAPSASWAPWCSTDLNSNSIYYVSRIKEIKEKVSSRFTIQSRRQALISLGRADLESVRGSGEGNPSPSSSSTILHHQFYDYSPPCVSNSIVGLLDGDGLDEIYHVIDLVLLGFDP